MVGNRGIWEESVDRGFYCKFYREFFFLNIGNMNSNVVK